MFFPCFPILLRHVPVRALSFGNGAVFLLGSLVLRAGGLSGSRRPSVPSFLWPEARGVLRWPIMRCSSPGSSLGSFVAPRSVLSRVLLHGGWCPAGRKALRLLPSRRRPCVPRHGVGSSRLLLLCLVPTCVRAFGICIWPAGLRGAMNRAVLGSRCAPSLGAGLLLPGASGSCCAWLPLLPGLSIYFGSSAAASAAGHGVVRWRSGGFFPWFVGSAAAQLTFGGVLPTRPSPAWLGAVCAFLIPR